MLLISPHLDDAALSCAVRLSRGQITEVVTIFAGLPEPNAPPSDWDRLTRASSAHARMVERRAEDRSAWDSVGLGFRQLDWREGRGEMTDHYQLLSELSSLAAGHESVLLPAGIGRHREHCLVRDVGLEAFAQDKSIILYGELPYAAFFGWPSDQKHLDVRAYWQSDLASGHNHIEPTVTKLSVGELAWKRALLSHYPSQLAAVGGGSLALFERTGLLDYEVEFPISS